MYESWAIISQDRLHLLNEGKHDPVLFHQGKAGQLLTRHHRHVIGASHGDMPAVGPYLMRRIADARTMRCAFDDIRGEGGEAAGPDGQRPSDLDSAEAWSLCRALAKAVKEGKYRPGPDRKVKIPKRPGSTETRTLAIQNLRDRIVAGATRLIVQPVIDPLLSPFSFGRPGRGAQHALATALGLAQPDGGRRVWLAEDIHDFFDRIPRNRLMRACSTFLPDAGETVSFIELIASNGARRGVRQGNSMSPLLAHIYRDHHISSPWTRRHPDMPLVSYLDDLLIVCRDKSEAEQAYADLAQLVTSAGLKLKGTPARSIRRLDEGQDVSYLGYRIGGPIEEPRITIDERAWDRLADKLMLAHEKPYSPLVADRIVIGWLQHFGPCYAREDRGAVLEKLYETGEQLGFDELPPIKALCEQWSAAHGRWRRLRDAEMLKVPHRCHQLA